MKKLTGVLLSVCMLTTVCSFTGCGGEKEKWEYAEDEGISVSKLNCSDIVSDRAKENIRKKLEEKYKDVNPTVTEESVEGLLKEVITLEKDDDFYFAESIRAEELDSIFEVNGQTADAYVDVSLEEDFIEYEIYAEYSVDTYCFAEVDFATPEYLAKEKAKKEAREKEDYYLTESDSGEKVNVVDWDDELSEYKLNDIADKLEERYENVKLNIINDNVSGLLTDETLKLDDDGYVYAEELDDLLSDDIYTASETKVYVSIDDEDVITFYIKGNYSYGSYFASLNFKASTAKEE